MSNAIRYDALLVRELARELDARLGGARLDAAFLDRDSLRVALVTRASRRDAAAPPGLIWQLHPTSGHLMQGAVADGDGRVQLGTRTNIEWVHALPDERVLIFELDAQDAPAGAARRIIIELVTNKWNAVAVGADGRITAVLRERAARDLRAGAVYESPQRTARLGALSPVTAAEWDDVMGGAPPGTRLAVLQRHIAYTGPLNAAYIIGDADVRDDEDALVRAHERYVDLAWSDGRSPALLRVDGRYQPYPRCEPVGCDRDRCERTDTLLDAFALAAERASAAPVETDAADRALSVLSQRLEALERRERRLREEQAGASAEAAQLRRSADLLLSQLHRVARGAAQVELDDFEGETVVVELDPAQSAADNARQLHEAARKRDRAARRLPVLLRSVEQERSRVRDLIARIRNGDVTAEELERIARPPVRSGARRGEPAALPYREYRTSTGHDVRVGRGARANDELTFRHSAPTDIWLHARDVGGAHVILRWDRPDENPPERAIVEAATLAALFSRARTSGVVAVDWTRRKYVRKPRKSAPGMVVPERVKTVFVEPDAGVEERMRGEG